MSIQISQFQNEFRLSAEVSLPRGIDEIFPFFAEAKNLEQITPPFLKFRVTSGAELKMGVDTVIDYSLRLHGYPLSWRSLISVWDPPYCFVDEQLKGPYRYWIHRHSFEQREGHTVAKDFVRYQVVGGKVLHDLTVKRDLMQIFTYRQKKLLELFS